MWFPLEDTDEDETLPKFETIDPSPRVNNYNDHAIVSKDDQVGDTDEPGGIPSARSETHLEMASDLLEIQIYNSRSSTIESFLSQPASSSAQEYPSLLDDSPTPTGNDNLEIFDLEVSPDHSEVSDIPPEFPIHTACVNTRLPVVPGPLVHNHDSLLPDRSADIISNYDNIDNPYVPAPDPFLYSDESHLPSPNPIKCDNDSHLSADEKIFKQL